MVPSGPRYLVPGYSGCLFRTISDYFGLFRTCISQNVKQKHAKQKKQAYKRQTKLKSGTWAPYFPKCHWNKKKTGLQTPNKAQIRHLVPGRRPVATGVLPLAPGTAVLPLVPGTAVLPLVPGTAVLPLGTTSSRSVDYRRLRRVATEL